MRIEKNQYCKLNFGLNINSAELEKTLEKAPNNVKKSIKKEISAVRRKYQGLQGDCELVKLYDQKKKPYLMIRGMGGEADVYSSATEKFDLEPGSLTRAFKGWVADYMKLRINHDYKTRKNVDGFGLSPYIEKQLAKRKLQKDARSFQECSLR